MSEPVPDPSIRDEEILAEGTAFLAAGELDAAQARLEYILLRGDEDGVGVRQDLHARALWHLGVLHLLPGNENGSRSRGLSFLARLAADYPATPEGLQARWVRDLVGDLEAARDRAAEQERTIQELNEAMEQLKRIDLDRRPAPPRADSIIRPRPNPRG